VVYVGTVDGTLHALSIADYDGQNATWSYRAHNGEAINSDPAVAAGSEIYKTTADYVYFGSDDETLHVVDTATGNRIWGTNTGGEVSSGVTVADGIVYFGSNDERVYAVLVDGERWGIWKEPVWSFKTGGEVQSTPTFADDTVFVGSLDGRVYALAAPPKSAFRPTEVPLEGVVPSDGQVVSSLEESRCAAFALLLVCAHIIADY
jgi:outer membrane protein assembly factor BamB